MEFTATYDERPRDMDHGPTVLIVDDNDAYRLALKSMCSDVQRDGAADGTEPAPLALHILECESLPQAEALLRNTAVHVVLLDKNVGPDEDDPAQNGINAIPRFLEIQPHLQILMVTSSETTEDIVTAIRNGAMGYVVKDNGSNLLIEQIRLALKYSRMALTAIRAKASDPAPAKPRLVGNSGAIQQLRRQVEALAKTETSILLLGETGTGKTVTAQIIHDLRQKFLKQDDRPFVAHNMAALPEELAERELFGNERGAYTGADEARPGLFELANGGTLFLDEIGEASPAIQAKLLTVLDRGVFKRLGATATRKSEFRLICATNKDLEQLIKMGLFREDLFMRISTISIKIPNLESRKDDIPEIIASVLPRCCKYCNAYVEPSDIPADFIESLRARPPVGNIRGIEQQVQRLLIFATRDTRGRLNMKDWRMIPGLQAKARDLKRFADPITFDEIMNRQFDIVGDSKFEGFNPFIDAVSKKLFLDARSKHPKSRGIAKALVMSTSAVSSWLRALGLSPRGAKNKDIGDSDTGNIMALTGQEVTHGSDDPFSRHG